MGCKDKKSTSSRVYPYGERESTIVFANYISLFNQTNNISLITFAGSKTINVRHDYNYITDIDQELFSKIKQIMIVVMSNNYLQKVKVLLRNNENAKGRDISGKHF